jgi:hypothetical protein
MKVGPKVRIGGLFCRLIAHDVALVDYHLRVLSHIVDLISLATRSLNERADLKRQLLFLLIRRNWRRDMESDLPNTGFLCLGGGASNILRLLCSLLDHMTGGRVRHGPEV